MQNSRHDERSLTGRSVRGVSAAVERGGDNRNQFGGEDASNRASSFHFSVTPYSPHLQTEISIPLPPPLFDMETLRDAYRDEDDEDTEKSANGLLDLTRQPSMTPEPNNHLMDLMKDEPEISDELYEDEGSDEEDEDDEEEQPQENQSPLPTLDLDYEEEEEDNTPRKKQKPLSAFTSGPTQTTPMPSLAAVARNPVSSSVKKPKKKNNNVWTKPTSRKGKKKTKSSTHTNGSASAAAALAVGAAAHDAVLITPIPRFPDRSDDSPEAQICLSKVYKAEKVELGDDRLTAGSCKGYRMVRATRGVVEGAWYFEIKVSKLGETGHTRLGWSMEKGDLQAPVGYDPNSFGYRDIDGSKVHKALREKYGEQGYVEGDVIGFYINLPDGELYAPKPPQYVWYKGQRYMCTTDGKEESLKVVPGSEISFFKNGICQGIAFKDLYGGRYYPAASMYTLPNQPNCVVKFNFGPDFECFPQEFDGRPIPRPMIEVPYLAFDGKVENGESTEKEH